MNNRIQRELTKRVISITEVNLSNYYVVGTDPYNSGIQVSMHIHDPLVVVPQVGEQWVVERAGNDWFLDRKIDNGNEATKLTELFPGDARLEVPGNLILNADVFQLGDQGITFADGTTQTTSTSLSGVFNVVNAAGDLIVGTADNTVGRLGVGTSTQVLKGGTTPAWGSVAYSEVTGTPNLSLYALLSSPTFSGVPAAPTAAVDTNTTQLATTAYVIGQGYLKSATAASTYAPLASPTFTGTPAAPTAAVDTNTTQLATTAYVLAQAASATPIVDGTGTVGTSTRFARGDHIHPTDTSRAALASPTFTGTPAAPTASGGTNTTQLATTAFVSSAVSGLSGAPGYGTSLPGSPVDGQEYILVDSTSNPTYQWRFRYNSGSSSTYKWEFIGGAPLQVSVQTQETTASGSATDLATVGPSITVARAGEYIIHHGCQAVTSATAYVHCAPTINGSAQTTWAATAYIDPLGQNTRIQRQTTPLTVGAGQVVKLQYYVGGGTGSFSDRDIAVTPVRVS